MLESIYNGLVFILASVGALRTGVWVVGRGWRWYWKAAALIGVAAAIIGFPQQIGGGPKTDLRIVTEILATAGTIFAVEFAFRHVADNRWRAVFVVLAGLFLYVTWTERVDLAMGTVKTAAPASLSIPVRSSSTSVDPMCLDPGTTYEQRQILACP